MKSSSTVFYAILLSFSHLDVVATGQNNRTNATIKGRLSLPRMRITTSDTNNRNVDDVSQSNIDGSTAIDSSHVAMNFLVGSQTSSSNPPRSVTGLESSSTSGDNKSSTAVEELIEIWQKEAKLAQNEIERMLLGTVYGSFPPVPCPIVSPQSHPTLGPLSNPTSIPTTVGIPTVPTVPTLPTIPIPPSTNTPTATSNIECLMGETPETYLFNQFSTLVNDSAILLNPTSPQGQAFNFTLGDLLINNNICTYPTLDQRFGLAVIYYATGGPNWFLSAQWLDAASECSWLGVNCENGSIVSNLVLRKYCNFGFCFRLCLCIKLIS
jgi:hypothetical protein